MNKITRKLIRDVGEARYTLEKSEKRLKKAKEKMDNGTLGEPQTLTDFAEDFNKFVNDFMKKHCWNCGMMVIVENWNNYKVCSICGVVL